MHYNNVENSGIENGMAYLSAELSLFSIDFDLVNMQQVPLCYDPNANNQEGQDQAEGADYYDAAEAGDQADYNDAAQGDYNDANGGRMLQDGYEDFDYENCPGDGSYSFSVEYVLPSAGRESASWLASGWTGEGLIEMFAQRNENMKIGSCVLKLNTFVSPDDSDSLINPPSAAATAGIILAVLAAVFLMCFYCYCCRSSKTKAKRNSSSVGGDDAISTFRRMEDDDNMTKPRSITVDAPSQAESKKSSSWKPWVSLGTESDKQPV